MLDLLKKIFKRREKKKPEVVSLEELQDWLENKRRKTVEEFLEKAKTAGQEWKNALETVKEKLELLARAELKNPAITEREKHFMEGNRAELARRTNQLLEKLTVFPSKTEEFEDFFNTFNQALEDYVKGTARPSQIVSEFFGQEVKELYSAIGKIEGIVNELKQAWPKTLLEEYKELESAANDFKRQKARVEGLQKEQSELAEKEKRLREGIEKTKKELELLKKSQAYLEQLQELEQARNKCRESERAILELFSPLIDGLKRVAHDWPAHQKLLKQYIENPVNALVYDYKLQILGIVPHLKKTIEELKEGKKLKALSALEKLTKENLSKLLHEYAHATREEQQLKEEKAKLPIFTRIKRFEEEQERLARELARTSQELERANKELSKINLEEAKEKIRSGLEKLGIRLQEP